MADPHNRTTSALRGRAPLVLAFVVVCAVACAATLLLTRSASPTASRNPLARAFQVDGTTLASCRASSGAQRARCREQALGNVAYRHDAGTALAQLQHEVQTSGDHSWASNAHIVQHRIGAAVLARLHGDAGRALAEGAHSTAFPGAGGYLHGVVIVAMRGADRAHLATRAAALCETASVQAEPEAAHWCMHGIGHALMIFSADDLPWALRGCDRLPGVSDQQSCYVGVFMENWSQFIPMMRTSGAATSHWVSSDLRYPCNAVAHRYRSSCYVQMMIRAERYVAVDFRRAGALCHSIEAEFAPNCWISVGYMAFDQGHADPVLVAHKCALQRDGATPCIVSAVEAATRSADRTGRVGASLCAQVHGAQQLACAASLGRQLRVADAATATTRCGALLTAAPAAAAACVRAAGTAA